MQLYLEGGAWFKKNHPWKKIKFFGYQKERVVKCQQASWPEDDVKPLRSFFHVKHLILIKVRTTDSRMTLFIPMCYKRYISKPQNKETGSVSRKTDSPMSLLSCSPFFSLNSHLEHGCLPCLLTCSGFQAHARRSPRRGTFRYSSGTGGPT